MATVTRNSPPKPPPAPPTQQSVANQRFIDGQLRRTSIHVKVVDLFGGMMMFAASVLVFLLFVAMADAWLFELGTIGRLLALAVVATSAVAYLAVYMIPLFFRRVNQEYAARMIEESEPTLKNSLINFLTFQSNRSAAHEVVQSVLEQRAAADLSHVPIESAVDRSKLIKVGYLLAGVMIVCALYKVLSPKDPFQTFARIASPFASISRPSRVQITNVEPGDTEVFRGTEVKVTASVDGIGKDDPVTLIYSTDDGQTVDARIPMAIADGADEYVCQLSTSDEGVLQDLNYRIVAGDANTDNYQVTVMAAPTIVVEKIELEFPRYTRREKQVIQRQGDVRAMEGTRAKIVCRANHKIKSAYIELNPADGGETSSRVRLKRVDMRTNEFEATGQFALSLDADRRTPVVSSYRVHFVSESNHRNERPIVHRVEVLPDMSPEVEILTPRSDVIEVPANEFTRIEVRAIDPDYGLSRISLRGVVGGTEVLDKTLFKNVEGQLGQTVVNEDFQPAAVGLEAGDLLEYWAIAADNRVSAKSGKHEPNETRTRPTYYIRVVAPKKEIDPFAEESDPDEKPKDLESPKDPDSRKITDETKGRSDPSEPPRSSDPSKEPGDAGDSSESKSDGGSAAGSTSGTGETTQSGGKSGEETGNSAKSSNGSATDSTSEGSKSGAGTSEKSSGNSSRNSGGAKSGEPGGGSTNGGKSDEPLHPGEVFERVLDHLKEQKKRDGERSEGGSTGDESKSNGSKSDGSKSEDGAKSDSSDGSQPEQRNQNGGTSDDNSSSQPANEKKDGGGSSQSGNGQKQSSGNRSGGEGGADSKSSQGGQPQSGGEQKSGNKSGAGNQQSANNNGGQSGKKSGSKQSQGGSNSGGSPQESGNAGSKPMGQNPQQGGGQNSGGQKKNGNEAGGGTGQQQNPGQNGGEKKSGGGKKEGGQNSGSGQDNSGQKSGGQESGGQKSGGQKKDGQQSGGQKSGGQESGGQKPGEQNSGGKKDGGQSGGGEQPNQSKQSNSGNESSEKKEGSKSGGNKNKKSGGQQSDNGKQGKSGGGKPMESSSGSSGGQKDQQQQKKQGGGGSEKKEGGAESTGGNQKKSGAKGEGQSDRSGAGSKGSGQSSGQAGNGKPGGSTPSKDGSDSANEKGQGKTSGQPGDDQAGGKTGRTGSQSGKGSSTRKSQGGSKKTSDPGSQAGGEEGSPFGGGGGQGNTKNTESKFDGNVADGDDPDLDYARKATDLALEYLRDQKEKPDRELLDKLNFTDEELRKFVERWDGLKRNAKKSDVPGRRELDESLRSLGLRPSRDTRRSGGTKSDTQRFGDSGGVSGPPAKFRDRFNAFIKGTARKADKE